jgi:hypothetical protein
MDDCETAYETKGQLNNSSVYTVRNRSSETASHFNPLSDSIRFVFSPSAVRKSDMGLSRLWRNQ